jgi:hypothetical protein
LLKRNLKIFLIGLFTLVLIIPTQFSFVSSSAGNITINSTSASIPGQQVQSGSNISLYFGNVMWGGDTVFLFLSTNSSSQIVSGDFDYTPKFSVANITNTTAANSYNDNNGGAWTVGSNWVNGSIAQNLALGNYYIKAFDQLASVAVTDTYITVNSQVYNATLNVSPSAGPGGVTIQFTGSRYPHDSTVVISYLDPTFESWNTLTSVTANATGDVVASSQAPDLLKSLGNGDFPQQFNQISYRTTIAGIVYSYASYNEYERGLKTVGNRTANGLYGNGTDLSSNVNVMVGDNITISGQWFYPGPIYIRWDGVEVVGTVTRDQWLNASIIGRTVAGVNGTFSTTVTIPTANAGEHYISVEDSQTWITVRIFVHTATLFISPSTGPGGVNAQFTGSSYLASTPVSISYLDPTFGTWNYWTSTTSDASGNIAFNSQMPDLEKSFGNGDSYTENASTTISFRTEINGVPYGYVNYNECSRGLKQVGTQIANGLYGNGTDLSSNVAVHVGDSILISGEWFHPGIVYIRFDGVQVVGTVTSSEWQNAGIIGSTTASPTTGSFATYVTIPTASGGSHFLAIEDSQTRVITKINVLAPVISPTPSPTPSPSPTSTPSPTATPTPTPNPVLPTPTLDLSCQSTTKSTDFIVEINGELSLNGNPMIGEPIQISYSTDDGKSWDSLTMIKTQYDGTFTGVWKPDVTGNYLIKASWEGNSTLNGVSKTVDFALTPDLQQNVFSVSSNSTITQFAFNSSSNELSFIVSGPPGTTGYVDIYIPKSLISDVSNLKAYIDGNQITFTSQSETDSWLISFSYPHSTHLVTMDLGNAVQPSSGMLNPDWTTYGIAIAVVAVIAGIATVFVTMRKAKK